LGMPVPLPTYLALCFPRLTGEDTVPCCVRRVGMNDDMVARFCAIHTLRLPALALGDKGRRGTPPPGGCIHKHHAP